MGKYTIRVQRLYEQASKTAPTGVTLTPQPSRKAAEKPALEAEAAAEAVTAPTEQTPAAAPQDE